LTLNDRGAEYLNIGNIAIIAPGYRRTTEIPDLLGYGDKQYAIFRK
jgi:hypothetical protein